MSEERRPSLPWISWVVKPSLSVGTRKQARPLCFFSGSVWAKISATSEKLPSEIHIFWPLIDQPPSVFVARVRRLAASEPVSGSVRPKQPSASPEQSRGSQLCFCSSRAPALDRAGDQRGLHGDHGAGGGVGAADLLDDQPVADVVEPAAAVLLGDRRAEVADLAQLARQLAVEARGAVVLAHPRRDLLVGELARRFGDQPLLVGQLEVHLTPAFSVRRRSSKLAAEGLRRTPPAPRGCAGPAPRAARLPSIAETAWISRVVEARKASSAARRSATGHSPSSTSSALTRRSRVIDSRTPSSSAGRAQGALRRDPEDRRGRRLEHDAVGLDEHRLVGALRFGEPRRLHVGGVGERLDAVEDHASGSR